jgi:hypothetical protein
MRTRSLLPLAALGLCVLAAPAAAADKAEKADATRIAKLIEQLGNDDFDEREKASTGLDALGEPALDALRQAVKSTDAEVRKRAETLVGKIEKRLEAATALKAKRVHLVYKDTAVKDAVEDFEKKSGCNLALYDPENKLRDRTITLDTGDAPFWRAFDQFCDKAGLKEAEAQDLAPVAPPAAKPPLPAPPGAFAPAPFTPPVVASDHITFIDGKAENLPTDAASAVRVRVLAKADRFGAPQKDEIPFALQLSLEPRLQWRTVEKVTITKAVDDQKQELIQLADPSPAVPAPAPALRVVGFAPGFIGGAVPLPAPVNLGGALIHQDAPFRLRKGEKVSKSLTELTGTVSALILTEAAPIITAPDILKAAGKTFKGGDNGQLKVVEVSKDENGRITLRVELQAPADVVPAGGPIGRGAIRRLGRGVPVAVAPPPAPAGGAVPPGGIVAARGAAVFIGAGLVTSAGGLILLDDKGEAVKLVGVWRVVVGEVGAVNTLQHVLTFQAEKGQEASKLIYSGRKVLSMEIPFTLKDAPLP